jgi:hypothetical protein
MSIQIDSKLLAVVVKALGITIPVRSARKLRGGAVEVGTRDGLQVWKPPKKKTVPESVSKPVVARKRATPAKKTGGKA